MLNRRNSPFSADLELPDNVQLIRMGFMLGLGSFLFGLTLAAGTAIWWVPLLLSTNPTP